MAGYDLDEPKSLLSFFSGIHANKVLSIGQRVSIKHYSMFDYLSAFVVDMSDTVIKAKFKSGLAELDFFPEDPVLIDFSDENNLYFLSGEIDNIDSMSPLILSIKVKKIEKKDTLRKSERFPVSLASTIDRESGGTYFSIVKNLSISGFKVNCKESINMGEFVNVSVIIDKYYNIQCTGKIVRKNKLAYSFEYGIEITEISQASSATYQNYINLLKSSN